MMIIELKILILSLLHSKHAFGDINLLNGSFSLENTDIHIRRDRRDFKLRRNYSSRRLTHGLFGFGWCSSLDPKLSILGKNRIELDECFDEPIKVFKRNESTGIFEAFSEEPQTNKNKEILVPTKNGYSRKRLGRVIQKFDKEGRLTFESSRMNQVPFQVSYEPQFSQDQYGLEKVETSTMATIQMVGEQPIEIQILNNLIQQIPKWNIRYEYINSDLTRVIYSDQTKDSFIYDQYHNLTKWVDRNNSQVINTYDQDKDLILEQASKKCAKKV